MINIEKVDEFPISKVYLKLYCLFNSKVKKSKVCGLAPNRAMELVQGFDQEAAAVVVARLTSSKMEMEVQPESTTSLVFFQRTFSKTNILGWSFMLLQKILLDVF
ncbi:uncharacterized protein LOC116405011 [Cucumis sativus]|uniref:uncharacterized protein LOC116405011 n=1 Tax=Cucumis sativus TaxID=3659 RepID=UPI0012F4C557|nr:uncharacterized protein LOC116405011 [Cucumis sativus]